MSDTPRTDEESYIDPTPGYEVVSADFDRQLERELAEARHDISVSAGCGERWAQRCMEARKQRDNLQRQNELFRNETLICADCDAIKKQAYDKAIKQRDTLAEALDLSLSILIALMDGNEDVYDLIVTTTNKNTDQENKMSVRKALEKSIAALAAAKGGEA